MMILRLILSYFGYCHVPKEAVQLSLKQEYLLGKLIEHETEEKGKQFFRDMRFSQHALTEFLQSCRRIQRED